MKNIKLADTLEKIRDNAHDFYNPNSTLVKDIVADIGPGMAKLFRNVRDKRHVHTQREPHLIPIAGRTLSSSGQWV